MLVSALLSFMKWTKDTMSSPPSTGTINSLIAVAVSARFPKVEIATVLGRPNWATESARWATAAHAAGKKVVWRCASDKMEGLYGVQHAVGSNRVSEQYYIDLAVNAILDNPTLFADGDEWAIYPERTEGIFQDSTSWITPQTPSHYASFFATLMESVSDASASVTVQAVSATPVITPAPIIEGSTSVAGTSSEANGTVIELFVDGVSVGTTTVSSGLWVRGVLALTVGLVLTAKATASGKIVSLTSSPVTVIAEDDDPGDDDTVLPFNLSSGGTPKLRFKQN